MKNARPSRQISVFIFALAACMLALPVEAPLSGKTVVDREKLYHGDPAKYSRPAVLDGEKVYRQVPAYREILERSLTRHDPDYWPLLRKAGRDLRRALRAVCAECGYDLVGEVGSIRNDDAPDRESAVPDITEDVIEKLEPSPKPPSPS